MKSLDAVVDINSTYVHFFSTGVVAQVCASVAVKPLLCKTSDKTRVAIASITIPQTSDLR